MIAKFLANNPRILLLTLIVVVTSGISSFMVMPRVEDPVLGKRVGLISVAFPGARARRVESLVTLPLEEQLQGISEIKQVRSNSQAGIANIVVELQDEVTDVDPVWTTVQSRIEDAQPELPAGALAPKLSIVPLKAFAAVLSVQPVDDDPVHFSIARKLAHRLRSELSALPGTQNVDIFGDPGEEYVAEVQPKTLAALEISAASIAQQVRGNQADQPAGRLPSRQYVWSLGVKQPPFASHRFTEAQVAYGPRGESTQLGKIAAIERRLVEPAPNMAEINGRRAIVLGAMVDDSRRVDQWAVGLEKIVKDFRAEFGDAASVELLFSQREHVDQRMNTLAQNLLAGTAAVVLVVLVLMGWRSMLVVAGALPLTALMVLSMMRMFGIPMHQMSVTGLIVALGLLIDNAIVMVEDIRSRIFAGATPLEAVSGGVRHLAIPLLGSTLTTALAFLPIALLPGPPGEFVGTIAVNVILAISASFVLAMTVVPAVTSWLTVDPGRRTLFNYGFTFPWLRGLYERSLRFVFRAPAIGVLLGIGLPIAGYLAATRLPEQFFPPSDRSQIQIEVELSASESLAATRSTAAAIRGIVAGHTNVESQHWFMGASAPTFFYNVVPRRRGAPYYAQAFVDIRPGVAVGPLVRELQTQLDSEFPQSRVLVRQLEQGPPFDAPIELRVLGHDLQTLQRLGRELRLVLSQTPNIIHTRSDLEETIPQLTFDIDAPTAKRAGVDRSEIAGQLYSSLEGLSAGSVFEDDEELPVRVKLAPIDTFPMETLAAMPLQPSEMSRRGAPPGVGEIGAAGSQPPDPGVPTLASLASWQLDSDVAAVVHVDGRRANEVKAYLQAGVLPSEAMADFRTRLLASDFSLPDGYSLEFGGEVEQRTDAVNKLIANGVVLFALILLSLVASFGSFRCALIIALVGGLSIGLGPLALAWFGFPMGFMAIVGTMGLVGLAINDSIVVLAAIRANADAKRGQLDHLVSVVVASTRHIVATTLTTMVGFLPLVLGGGGFWPPLAITIAGGVGGATLLALYFAPSCHLLLFGRDRS